MFPQTASWQDFILQQFVAESYLDGVNLNVQNEVANSLVRGNNRPGFIDRGFTKFTQSQATSFLSVYRVVHQASDYPNPSRVEPVYYEGTDVLANTGMSATLIQKKGTTEFTLSIRSTEIREVLDGGDRDRDAIGADFNGIVQTGLALAQLSALEKYFAWLKTSGRLPSGSLLNVTGYSLGGHLATVFTEIHAADTDVSLERTYTFNGAGRGTWSRNANDPKPIIDYYEAVLADPEYGSRWANPGGDALYDTARALRDANRPYDPVSIYRDYRHKWAEYATKQEFGMSWLGFGDQGSADLRNGAASKITQIYGREFPFESTLVANSGVHGPATGVFTEAQPLFELSPETQSGASDYGNGHALVLIADALAVMRVYQTLDLRADLNLLNELFSAASNKKPQSGSSPKAEDDPLEIMLDALRRLFLGRDVPFTPFKPGGSGFGDFEARRGFYENLDGLTGDPRFATWAINQVRLTSVVPLSASELVDSASADIAYRYALKELNSFVIGDAAQLHESHNEAGDLTLYQPAATPRGMTNEYLVDRSAMLAWLMYRNVNNAGEIFLAPNLSSPVLFADLLLRADGKPIAFRIVPQDSQNPGDLSPDSPSLRRFLFGTDRAEGLFGGPASDRLYGALSADVLGGQGDADYLEGGAGLDVYVYGSKQTLLGGQNDGQDVILDTDGKGVLRYSYAPFLGASRTTVIGDASKKQNDTTWFSSDDRFKFEKVFPEAGRTDLVVTILGDAGGQLILKDFRDGDFGIRPRQPRIAPNYGDPANTVAGGDDGRNSLTGTPDADLIQAFAGDDTVSAGTGNDLVLGGDGDDLLLAEAEDDRIYGEAGRDTLDGGDGADELYGGPGVDIVAGRAGSDLIMGEDGSDLLTGDEGADEIFSGSRNALANALLLAETETGTGRKGDWLDGGEDDDLLVAGADNDQLMGGSGADVMVGGAGDDNLVGDWERILVHVDNWAVTRQTIVSEGSTSYQLVYNGDAQASERPGSGDWMYGGAGADWLYGGAGDDYLDGGSGDDVVFGEAGSDILLGGAGNDVIVGDNPGVVPASEDGGDYLDGGSGSDTLQGNGGDDILVGGPGADVLAGGPGKDLYLFEKGDAQGDILFDTTDASSEERSELIFGSAIERSQVKFFPGSLGIDLGPSDPSDPSSGRETIHIQGFNPLDPYSTPVLGAIRFADGSSMTFDEILAQGFDIDGTESSDNEQFGGTQLRGTAVADRIRGFGGHDLLFGFAGADILSGGEGNDALVADEGNDTLSGDAGSDSLWGGAGDDSLDGGGDDDILYGNEGADLLDGGVGNDALYGHVFAIVDGMPLLNPLDDGAADVLRGGAGNDFLNAGAGADSLDGGPGDDFLEAESGDDWLDGGDGNDTLIGGEGNDVLAGGTGDDWLRGGAGDDAYLLAAGDGHDVVSDGGLDTVTFGEGIAPAELHLWKTGLDLVIGNATESDTWTIANWYAGSQYQISEFRFADGTTWSSDLASSDGARTIRGTPGNDVIAGASIDEEISGLAGNDQLSGNVGADTLSGGPGDDTLTGGAGADTYRFNPGDGRDVIQESGFDSDALIFGPGLTKAQISPSRSGNDLVLTRVSSTDAVVIKEWFTDATRQVESIRFAGTGESFAQNELVDPFLSITGTNGNDWLSGGDAYGEQIFGLAGNDELHGGGGNDSLTGGRGNDALFGENGNDRYFFAAGDGQDVVTDTNGVNVLQFGPGLVDKLNIASSGFDKLISFTGTTDSVLVKGLFPTLAFELYGTNNPDTLTGSAQKDLIWALGGNDSVQGGDGIDEIHGGPGNDTLVGGRHIDELWGDEGDDLLDGGIIGPDTAQNVEGYSTRFHGGPGTDTLYGSNDADTYYFDLGDGQDSIFDEPFFSVIWYFSFSDEVVFGPGITADSLTARTAGADLVVDVNATDRLILKNWYSGTPYRIDRFVFSDRSSLNEAQIGDLVNVKQGTPGNDVLTGTDAGNDRLYGKAGNDTLAGMDGDDQLDGGPGNDILDGGAGNDLFVVRLNEGSDLIRDAAGVDTLRFGEGISASSVSLERSANNLLIRLPDGAETVTVENYLKNSNAWIETVVFADGSSLPNADTIVEQLIAVRGTAAAESLSGTAYSDRLYGLEGSDTLSGGGEDDTLTGGEGDDLLAGGTGNDLLLGSTGQDLYQFNAADGADTILEFDAGNLVRFGAGIAPASVTTIRAADDLLLNVSGTNDRLSIPNYFAGYPVSEFRFSDGTVWTSSTIKTKVTAPTSGADTLIGFETNDSLAGLAGADTIYGRAGNDTLDGGLGSDVLYGEDGNDILIGGTGESKTASVSNTLYGGNGNDVLLGGGNAKSLERLDGGAGMDLLIGGIAAETMEDTGYDGGNALFFGGAAVDTMRMYGGASAIAIGGSDNDRMTGGQGSGVQKTQMLVAYNKADGVDTVDQLAPGSTLSIGGGALYSNLSLEVSGSALRLKTSSSTYVSLSDWYSTAPGSGGKAVSILQVVIEGTKDYKPTSTNPMNNAKVVAFDFLGLVAEFDSARAAGQAFTVANALPNHRLWSSNTEAIGGAIAYQYAKTSSLGTLTYDQMRGVLGAPAPASTRQTIVPPAAMVSVEEPMMQADADSLMLESLTAGDDGPPRSLASASLPDAASQAAPCESPAENAAHLCNASIPAVDPRAVRTIPGLLENQIWLRPSRADEASGAISASPVEEENAAAWRRIGKRLPIHMQDPSYEALRLPDRSWTWSRFSAAGNDSLPVVPAVGVADTGGNALKKFDGLKEGFAML